jgi:uncharacterized membrane protein (UPF0127 family)
MGRKVLNVYIADNILSRAIGYMFRDPEDVSADEGILFVYDKPVHASFWMLEVHFPIDIYILDEKFRSITKQRLEKHSIQIKNLEGRMFLEVKSNR